MENNEKPKVENTAAPKAPEAPKAPDAPKSEPAPKQVNVPKKEPAPAPAKNTMSKANNVESKIKAMGFDGGEKAPTVKAPEVKTPTANTPKVNTPKVNTPKVNVPQPSGMEQKINDMGFNGKQKYIVNKANPEYRHLVDAERPVSDDEWDTYESEEAWRAANPDHKEEWDEGENSWKKDVLSNPKLLDNDVVAMMEQEPDKYDYDAFESKDWNEYQTRKNNLRNDLFNKLISGEGDYNFTEDEAKQVIDSWLGTEEEDKQAWENSGWEINESKENVEPTNISKREQAMSALTEDQKRRVEQDSREHSAQRDDFHWRKYLNEEDLKEYDRLVQEATYYGKLADDQQIPVFDEEERDFYYEIEDEQKWRENGQKYVAAIKQLNKLLEGKHNPEFEAFNKKLEEDFLNLNM